MRFQNNSIPPATYVMSKKSLWVKKRHSDTARAKAQQWYRRQRGLFRKAAEFCLECESDVLVAVRIWKTGQMYILDSSSRNQWLNTLSNLVCPIKVFFHHPTNINRRRTTLTWFRRRLKISCPSLVCVCRIREAYQLLPYGLESFSSIAVFWKYQNQNGSDLKMKLGG